MGGEPRGSRRAAGGLALGLTLAWLVAAALLMEDRVPTTWWWC